MTVTCVWSVGKLPPARGYGLVHEPTPFSAGELTRFLNNSDPISILTKALARTRSNVQPIRKTMLASR